MKPVNTPLPITDEEAAKLLGISHYMVMAYRNGILQLPESDLQKLEQLESCWAQLNKEMIAAPLDAISHEHEISRQAKQIQSQLIHLDYNLFKLHDKLKILEERYQPLPAKRLLLDELDKNKNDEHYDLYELSNLRYNVFVSFDTCDPYTRLAIQYRINLLEAEQAIKKEMLEQLKQLAPWLMSEDTEGKP